MRQWWRRSTLEVDALSWFTSSIAIGGVAVLVILIGTLSITLGGHAGSAPELQILSIVVMASTSVLIHGASQPRGHHAARQLSKAVFVAVSAAVSLSALGYSGEPPAPELWWAPVGAGLVLMSVSPTVPGRVYVPGVLGVVAVTATAAAILAVTDGSSTPIADTVIASSSIVYALIGGSVLNSMLLLAIEGWRAGQRTKEQVLGDPERVLSLIDEVTDRRLSSQVMVFLARVTEHGEIHETDRLHAARLAERLRDDLVQRDQQDWISSLVAGRTVLVDDPERLAETITVEQRGALIALLNGLFSDPRAGVRSARLTLARRHQGTVAVGLTIDLTLPEGRRTSVLTPYYLTVKSVVPRVEWRNGESLYVAFDVDGR